MKLLELCVRGKISRAEDGYTPMIGNVDLYRAIRSVETIAPARDVMLTLTVEEIETSVPLVAVPEETERQSE
jgi:hypothetical protein